MLFAIGTKVKFLHTGDEGIVRARLEKGMVSVYLPKDDMEIPAAEEDLIRAEMPQKSPVKANVVEGKKEPVKTKPPAVKVQTQYTILKSAGIQLAFIAVEDREGLTEKYLIYLINDTQYDIIFNIKFWLNYRSETWSDKLGATSYLELGSMLYDDLNEAPEFDMEVSWITTEGVGKPLSKSLKIKAKSFFNTMRTAPLINQPAHIYKLFDKPVADNDTEVEDLEAYTRRHAKPGWAIERKAGSSDSHSSRDFAEFSLELDLHIEKLREDFHDLSKAEILAIQLSTFDAYINEAVRLQVPGVFVIHGVGKGKLRNAIATRLMNHPDVMTFKNEFHPKYGWGATEIIF